MTTDPCDQTATKTRGPIAQGHAQSENAQEGRIPVRLRHSGASPQTGPQPRGPALAERRKTPLETGLATKLQPKIAALYVEADGVYFDIDGVDPWDASRDARTYEGDAPVVAHPPCKRWGRYYSGGPSAKTRRHRGDDGGCFAAAVWAVRTFGGVIEHPEASSAWRWFGWPAPPRRGGWVRADEFGGWTCCVEQLRYGHRAVKATWLYAVSDCLPSLDWGKSPAGAGARLDAGFHSTEERAAATSTRVAERLTPKENLATPQAFADLLVSIARSATSPVSRRRLAR